ncbi:hypothetical protein GGG16DRAFT_118978 [Schizophyllum commune]
MADDLTQRLYRLSIANAPSAPAESSPPAYADAPSPPAYAASALSAPVATSTQPSPAIATSAQPSPAIPTRSRRKGKKKHGGYVVFVGKQAGVYRTWSECNEQVYRVSHSVHHGYQSVTEARYAFEVAKANGLTFSCGEAVISVGGEMGATRLTMDDLYPCLAFIDDAISSAIAPDQHGWYVVFKGKQPGVFRTYLEVSLYTTGLASAVQVSYSSRDEAVSAFERALGQGRVYRLIRDW